MEIEMTLKGCTLDPITNMPIILLGEREGRRVLPIWIGHFEAISIEQHVENAKPPRPMTYDLLKSVIDDLGGEVERVVVCGLKENTFYAAIYIRSLRGVVSIDARPSDAINLALRPGSKIFVEESVIEGARSVDMQQDAMDVGRLQKWLESLSEEDVGKYKM